MDARRTRSTTTASPVDREAVSLRGRSVVIDPGHNGGNAGAASQINRQVGVGQGVRKACNTTGTATNSGYSEADFTWDVAKRARRLLVARGVEVQLTRSDNTSVGPCIDERARIANAAEADATVSIHADGAAPGASGFHVIEPARIAGLTDDIFIASHRLALDLRSQFRAVTGQPFANYTGTRGIDRRSDLGGLRLADVPAVFIETGNMRNAGDARELKSAMYREKVASGIVQGMTKYLER